MSLVCDADAKSVAISKVVPFVYSVMIEEAY